MIPHPAGQQLTQPAPPPCEILTAIQTLTREVRGIEMTMGEIEACYQNNDIIEAHLSLLSAWLDEVTDNPVALRHCMQQVLRHVTGNPCNYEHHQPASTCQSSSLLSGTREKLSSTHHRLMGKPGMRSLVTSPRATLSPLLYIYTTRQSTYVNTHTKFGEQANTNVSPQSERPNTRALAQSQLQFRTFI